MTTIIIIKKNMLRNKKVVLRMEGIEQPKEHTNE